jgi:hypothetical protein
VTARRQLLSLERRNTRGGEIEVHGEVHADFMKTDHRTGKQW